jgi:hypothetical protein
MTLIDKDRPGVNVMIFKNIFAEKIAKNWRSCLEIMLFMQEK